ncbi:MAG: sugar ABC transporter substrate-binding protein [Chloroflexi bacterium]|nr:sugar ABC transporter substrate-binding protein [Chloroflexota bacterium]
MKKLSVLLVLVFLVLAAVPGAFAQEKITISIVAGEWWYSEEGLSSVGGSIAGADQLREYMELNPNIEFDVRGVPFPELDSTQLAAMESGQGPDIMIVNSVTVGSFIDRGYLMPMNDLIETNGLDTSIFFPGLYNSAVVGDQVFGLPLDTGTRLLYYNKAMFEAAGVEPPKTWDELPEVAAKMTDADNGVYGLVATTGERWVALYEHLGMYALANNLNFVNPEATECVLNQGDNVQAIQYWVDLFNKGVMSQDLLLTDTGSGREQAFGNGKAAMFLGGFWAADVLKADYDMTYPDDYGIVPLAGTDGDFASSTGGWIFTITRDSKHPQEALDYLAWVLSDGERLSKFTTIMPSTEAASKLSLQGEFYEPFKMLLAQPNTRHPIPLNPGLPEQAEVLRNVVQSALLGEMTAQEAADSFCEQIQGTLFQP